MWTLVEDPWSFKWASTSSGISDQLKFPASGSLLKVGWSKILWLGTSGLMFFQPSRRIALVITPGDDRHLQNGSKVMPNLDETRARLNPPNKGDETEKGLCIVRNEWEYPNLKVACRRLLHSSLPLIWVGHTPWMNGKVASTQWLFFSEGKDYE